MHAVTEKTTGHRARLNRAVRGKFLCGCQSVGAADCFLVWNVGGYLGEGRPLTMRDIIATATGVVAIGALFTGVSWQWWLVAGLGYFFYACVGHSVGYHRYFAHRSFRAPRWAEVMFTVAGVLGCIGSPVGWAQMHRRHHVYSDREGDPYTAHRHPRPTWRALMVSGYDAEPGSARGMRRMFRTDRLQVFVMRYYFGIVAGFAGTLWLVDWRWFVYGWAVPVGWTLWMAGLDAWATHRHGYRNHDTPDASRNLWWCALLSWGEGWHNNHHANPRAWSYRERWWEWDPGAVVVWAILRLSRGRASRGMVSEGAA